MPVRGQEFLMPVGAFSAKHLRCSAERSWLLAEALHRSDRLPQSIRFKVYGESMLPALWPGDVVEIVSCSIGDVQPSDIVLALRDGRLFLHRLVAANTNGFLLRGDSMPGCDPEYSAEALLGKLVCTKASLATRLRASCSRTVGFLLCHCPVARRLALRLHARARPTSLGEIPNVELL